LPADSYVDVRQASSEVGRERERAAFDHCIALLERARDAPDDPEATREALRTIQILWRFLIKDLASPANDLSEEIKDDLVAIGLWVIGEADAITAGTSQNWAGLIDINRTVREGLAT
jgi:flagellar protein FlaF